MFKQQLHTAHSTVFNIVLAKLTSDKTATAAVNSTVSPRELLEKALRADDARH
jgi:hypothetical protein